MEDTTPTTLDRGVELATVAQSWREAAERLEMSLTVEHDPTAVATAKFCREWARYWYAQAAQYLEGEAYGAY